jgi:hypothetical protein
VAAELETYYLELRGELPVTAEPGTAAEVGETPARV